MPNVTVSLSSELKVEMDRHPEVNWSSIARAAFRSYLKVLICVRLEADGEIARSSSDEAIEVR